MPSIRKGGGSGQLYRRICRTRGAFLEQVGTCIVDGDKHTVTPLGRAELFLEDGMAQMERF